MIKIVVDFGVDWVSKKVPSGRRLNYHGGPLRGDHFIGKNASRPF